MINAIVNARTGKVVKFSKKEIEAMIAEISAASKSEVESNHLMSDSLPKWLCNAGYCKRTKQGVLAKLRSLNKKRNVTIDVSYYLFDIRQRFINF